MTHKFLVFLLLGLTYENVDASQVKAAKPAAAQESQAHLKIVRYDVSVHKDEICKLLRADTSGVCNTDPCRLGIELSSYFAENKWICIHDHGSIIGVIYSCGGTLGSLFRPDAKKVCIRYLGVREDCRRQGVGETLLQHELHQRFLHSNSHEPFFLELHDIESAEPIKNLCRKLGFAERLVSHQLQETDTGEFLDEELELLEYSLTREDYMRKFSAAPEDETKESC